MAKRARRVLLPLVIVTVFTADAEAGGLEGYRDGLARGHGPFVAAPTYIGAAIGAAALTPVSLVYGVGSLLLFRDNPARVAESWVTAPKRGWYWGGMVLGTPFRVLKGVLWDAPKAVFRLLFRHGDEPRATDAEVQGQERGATAP